jgi:hypothetical protein
MGILCLGEGLRSRNHGGIFQKVVRFFMVGQQSFHFMEKFLIPGTNIFQKVSAISRRFIESLLTNFFHLRPVRQSYARRIHGILMLQKAKSLHYLRNDPDEV